MKWFWKCRSVKWTQPSAGVYLCEAGMVVRSEDWTSPRFRDFLRFQWAAMVFKDGGIRILDHWSDRRGAQSHVTKWARTHGPTLGHDSTGVLYLCEVGLVVRNGGEVPPEKRWVALAYWNGGVRTVGLYSSQQGAQRKLEEFKP
jgi:hypothetical protein